MASPSVTYTFANSTVADATQVNTNFSDLISGLTDGTKDLSISALTCAGNATLNGNLTVGNASSDTLTITASLASSIAIGTTFSYDFGSSTVGLKSIYFGDAGSNARTTRVIGGTIASSYTLTLPATAGSSRDYLQSDGSGGLSFVPILRSSNTISNYSLAASVGSNLLTVTLNAASGSAPSSTNPVDIVFRSSTITSGAPVTRSLTAAPSVNTVSTGASLGTVSAQNQYIYVYAIDNAGTVELALAGNMIFDEGKLQNTTAIGAASSSNQVLYSTTARSNVAVRLLGRLLNNQTTAGTYGNAPTAITIVPFNQTNFRSYAILDTGTTHGSSGTATIRWTNATTIGSALTITQSATAGDSMTVNEDGLYSVLHYNVFSGGVNMGVTKNGVASTQIQSQTQAATLCMSTTAASGAWACASTTVFLATGDILRAQDQGTSLSSPNLSVFMVIKISD